jgi:Ca2+-dependent lipid-binding protein
LLNIVNIQNNARSPPPESVEWLNAIVKSVWPILDPDLFEAGVDLMEDALKAASPAIVVRFSH